MGRVKQEVLDEIVRRIVEVAQPERIILFGSHAYGSPSGESDVDLLVVLDSDEMPQTFEENLDNKLVIRDALGDLSAEVDIDLIVHTRPMHEKFIGLGSMFAREVLRRGRVCMKQIKTARVAREATWQRGGT